MAYKLMDGVKGGPGTTPPWDIPKPAQAVVRDKTDEWDFRPDTPRIVTLGDGFDQIHQVAQQAQIVGPDVVHGQPKPIRMFEGGATRDVDTDKIDPEGFLSPLVIEAFCEYMAENRHTAIGVRDSDNWQKGIPLPAYMKSLWRHFLALWAGHRVNGSTLDRVVDAMGIMFNTQGYVHELLKDDPAIIQYIRAETRRRRERDAAKRKPGGSPPSQAAG